jgi:cytochrome c oxidase subunit 3
MEKAVDLRLVEEPKKPLAMNAKKFGMWLFLASVMMLFMSITSAYIVRRAEGNWVYFELPLFFYYSAFIAVIGSVFIQVGYFAAKRNAFGLLKTMIILSVVSGVLFLASQYLGFVQLVKEGHYFAGNPAESFTYVIPWLHGLHIVSAVIFLLIMLSAVFKGKVHSGNMTKMEMCTTYWHFLGALWLYLFVFLLLYR